MMERSENVIEIEIMVDRELDLGWEHWTLPEHIMKWNFASDDWKCPSAEIDLRKGGKFNYRMESKDGNTGFDFTGKYDEITDMERISSTLDDGRRVEVLFKKEENGTKIIEMFEADRTSPMDMQKMGWQSILDNFKKYVESS
jgi:uncharacterized protein YndB with AHSA1/START domain